MGKKVDLTGQRFGRLTVLKDSGNRLDRKVVWLCMCDCGQETLVRSTRLRKGTTRSCGCLRRENAKYPLYSKHSNWEKSLAVRKEILYKEKTYLPAIARTKPISTNTSGVTGVYWVKSTRKWQSAITFQNKVIHLGTFSNKQDAIDARKEAEEKYFKPILEKYKQKDPTSFADEVEPHTK